MKVRVELIEHKRFETFSHMAWSVPSKRLQSIHRIVEQFPAMKKIQVLFHDAGGGHRNKQRCGCRCKL